MRSWALRTRVLATALTLLTATLVTLVVAITLIYQDSLRRDLRHRLTTAAAAMRHEWPTGAKQIVSGLALEGIEANIVGSTSKGGLSSTKPITTTESNGSLLLLTQTLPDGARVTYTASEQQITSAVTRLLTIEAAVTLGVLIVGAGLLLWGVGAALRPVGEVAETARRITAGERTLRLRTTRTDTDLGAMVDALDRMVDSLNAAVARAEAAEDSMRTFLADASHELRTPIAALQATVETLLREQPNRPQRDDIEANLARDTARLGRLAADLLALARLEAQGPPLVLVDLASIAAQTIDDLRRQAADGTSIGLTGDKACPGYAEPAAIARILRNLLENAINVGASRITVDLRRGTDGCELTIDDDGPGIADSDRDRMFERFTRLDDNTPGHGLGLAIARRIANQHHGTLTCDDKRDGARFTLTVPLAEPPPRLELPAAQILG